MIEMHAQRQPVSIKCTFWRWSYTFLLVLSSICASPSYL